jgi:hypothetical protein
MRRKRRHQEQMTVDNRRGLGFAGCEGLKGRTVDALICAICVLLLVGWARDRRRQMRARDRWHLRAGMSLEDKLETRRRILDDLNCY